MRRWVFGSCVLVASAAATLAIALHAMSPPMRLLYVSATDTLPAALATEYAVTVRSPAELPASLASYDRVVISDVPAHLLDAAALEAYVRGGGSLIVAGGADSFGSGGYEATPLERLLPIRFGGGCRSDAPDLAFAIVADEAVAIPADVAELLSPSDYLAVIRLDHDVATVRVHPQRAANRRRIADQLAVHGSAADGGNLTVGLHDAYAILDAIPAMRKHVLVVAGAHDTAPDDALVAAMRDHDITMTVAHTGDLATILANDVRAAARVDDTDRVLARAASPRFAALVATAPPLYGYVSARAKPAAETLVRSDTYEPLLARWHYGAGTVTAWTSDVGGAWSRDWLGWRGYQRFWSRVLHGD